MMKIMSTLNYKYMLGVIGKSHINNHNKCGTINPLAPNDVYICRTAQLTSRRCILNIYSTNILTEYFKNAAQSPFFPSRCRLFHNVIFFSSCNIQILNTECAKILK